MKTNQAQRRTLVKCYDHTRDNAETIWVHQFFGKQKSNFGRHKILCKPVMYFILDKVQSQPTFICSPMTPGYMSCNLEQDLTSSCLCSWSTGVTEKQLHIQYYNCVEVYANTKWKKVSANFTALAGRISIDFFTFLKHLK